MSNKKPFGLTQEEDLIWELIQSVRNFSGGGGGGGTIISVNGQTGPTVTITKSDVGLGNADNTSDVNKPVSSATATALALKEDKSSKGIANGYGSLNGSGRQPLTEDSVIAAPSADLTVIIAGDGLQQIANKTESRITANTASIAVLTSASQKRFGSFANKTNVVFGSMSARFSTLSDGIVTTETSRKAYKSIGSMSDVQILLSNVDAINTTTINACNDVTVEASIEYPVGTFTRVTFNDGSNTFLLRRGFTKLTDLVKVAIPPNTTFYIRVNVLVNLGEKWLKGWTTDPTFVLGGEGFVTGTNSVMSGTITDTLGYTFCATAVIGVSDTHKGSIFYFGDSISCGVGDAGQPSYGYQNSGGFFNRAFGTNYPVFMSNIPSQNFTDWDRQVSPIKVAYYDEMLSCCQFGICELGINSIGLTLAALQAAALKQWAFMKARGIKIYQTTLTPKTSSTDSWATLTNQTVTADESKRVGFNDWVRDGAPFDTATGLAVAVGATSSTIVRMNTPFHPLAGYFEIADLVESSHNSGKWRIDLGVPTADGLHPSAVTYAAGTPAIDITKFAV